MKRSILCVLLLSLVLVLFEPFGNVIAWGEGDCPDDNDLQLDDAEGPCDQGSSDGSVGFEEDFESYENGTDILGTGNWIEDDARFISSDNSEFTATTEGPKPPPSSQVGKIYNHDDDYSFILSSSFNLTSGVLEGWVAVDRIFYGETFSMSSMVSLMITDSETPDFEERAVTLVIRDGGIGYRTKPQTDSVMIVESDITANTWYRFKIVFNCLTEEADISIYDSNGMLLGSAFDTPFMCPADSIKRLELTTARDRSMVYTTSYWDDITITEYENLRDKGCGGWTLFLPGFEMVWIVIALAVGLIIWRRKV